MGTQKASSSTWLKWLGFVTAVWVQSISGNNYTFSNYSDSLKTLMSLTQLQLNTLSVAKDVGKAFGILAGLASDRFPTPLILLIGSLEGLLSYGLQFLVVNQSIKPLPYSLMCVVLCMGGNSTTWMNTAVLVTCFRNFKRNRGPVSGILKGYIGLSTAIFTDLCSSLFASDPASFLLLLAVVPAVVCSTAMIFLRESPPSDGGDDVEDDEDEETRYFGAFNVVSVIIALYLLAYDVSGEHGRVLSRVFASVLLVLLASPLAVPAYVFVRSRWSPSRRRSSGSDAEEPLLVEAEAEAEVVVVDQGGEKEEEVKVVGKKMIGEDHTIIEAIRTVDFWVLFVSFLCGVGSGLAVMNNMGQMGLAMGYSDVSVFVSLTSIGGFFGRIGSGTLSEYSIRKAAVPRPLWNAVSQIVMAVGYIVMAIAMPGSLYIGSVVVGVCYGVRLAVSVPVASELFGLKYYGLIYNILILNLPLGSFLFSGLLAGLLYDSQATHIPRGGNTCVGAHCYRLVFVIMSFACLLGFGLDLLLTYRTKNIYLKIYESKKSRKQGTSKLRVKT
ncbi:hypothetical protein QJS10_CPB11g01975 [Acorus calamus]|uniref:Nodulin-like domain-containing protein n=1 Tax=Acorus calamus TaxID=4465 RepID=A0AAV9DUW2_ACOCL|nr:hypothetical protein QJS10_CPB11g01975 [Acorus calamus]